MYPFLVIRQCLALMLLNFYLQKVTTENKINNETDLLSQIRDNTDQMIEVTNYATCMLMTNKNTLKNLRILEQDGDSYEIIQSMALRSDVATNSGCDRYRTGNRHHERVFTKCCGVHGSTMHIAEQLCGFPPTAPPVASAANI